MSSNSLSAASVKRQLPDEIPGAYAGFHFGRGCMASAGARVYNGGLGAVTPAGSRGRAPGGESGGLRPPPPEAESYLL